jgi:hypothetical protein
MCDHWEDQRMPSMHKPYLGKRRTVEAEARGWGRTRREPFSLPPLLQNEGLSPITATKEISGTNSRSSHRWCHALHRDDRWLSSLRASDVPRCPALAYRRCRTCWDDGDV